MSALQQQFRSDPVSYAAVGVVWSPDSHSVAIGVRLTKDTEDTYVYALRNGAFIPIPLQAFEPDRKVIPIRWAGKRDLVVSISGSHGGKADHPVYAWRSTYRLNPDRIKFTRVYSSQPSKLGQARMLYYYGAADLNHSHKSDFYRRRDARVVLTGAAAENTYATLRASPLDPNESMSTGVFGLGTLVYIDAHGRPEAMIDMTDAPRARIFRVGSNATFFWDDYEPLEHIESHQAPDFYLQILPDLRRVAPKEIESNERFIKQLYHATLDEYVTARPH